MPTVEFWYEFASTYSYLAAERVEGVARVMGVDVRWRPFLLGPIFAAQGWTSSPFNLYPAKGDNMWRDVERTAMRYHIAWARPSHLPRNGLLASRVALVGADDGWIANFSRAVFRANFVEDRDIGDVATIADIISRLGLPSSVLERANAPQNKSRLKAQTDAAIALGVYGAPSFTVDKELFWGHDRMEQAFQWATTPWM
ncbi:2-hydroxychromene-2-carboxylate isomerase [Vineibacter terrae]|uniref:2-hydroxychromene-2-carboxylate isomerase n=1 Tax=Vineibacter terrae TaxID=2586908 RepID=A0A5C8P6W3_9HYPH|nr:2-hydroxychromene-2-carboxylate isomerase [Vineibacter terrae]TXL69464.1 2-hydroxychromene-2-carboxylate isomerase [Vineibacter terrae]